MTQPDGAVRDALKLAMEVVGETLAEEKKKMRAELRAELAREVAALRNEFLADRLDAERASGRCHRAQ